MRILSLLLASLTLTAVAAQTAAPESFCIKYAKAVFGKTDATLTQEDQYKLIAAVVGRTVVGCDNDPNKQYGVAGVDTHPIFKYYSKAACGTNPAGITSVTGLVGDPLNAPFFAGSVPDYESKTNLQNLNTAAGIGLAPSIRFLNVTNFTVAANPATTGDGVNEGLVQHLVSFFGIAFQCNVTNTASTSATGAYIGKYNGNGNMGAVHAKMNITKAVWNEFVNSFANTLKSFGVADADITKYVIPVIAPLLKAPQGGSTANQICNQADCDCVPGYVNTGGNCVAAPTTAAPTTAAPTATPTPNPKNNNTATALHASPLVVAAAVGLTMLF